MDDLVLALHPLLRAHNGGLFVSPGNGTHPDRVIDSHELIFVRRGTLHLREEEHEFAVPEGHALVLWPGRRHRGTAPYDKGLSFYWVHFALAQQRRKGKLSVPQLARVARPDRLSELFHRFLDDQDSGRLGDLDAELLLVLMLCEVARRPEAATDRGSVLAARAETYVASHLAENLSTSHIARALRVNPDYLNRVFRRMHGQTLTEYVHRRRLRDARLLLRDTTASVAEVAGQCGIGEVGYFRRLFRRYEGVSPAAYRKLYARTHVNVR